jgi:hypothetical protein
MGYRKKGNRGTCSEQCNANREHLTGVYEASDGLRNISASEKQMGLKDSNNTDHDNILDIFNTVFHNLSNTQFTTEERLATQVNYVS